MAVRRRGLLRLELLGTGALLLACQRSVGQRMLDRPVATRPPVEQVLIGAFDVGPGGCPQCLVPARRSAGLTWLSKLWAPLVTWDPSMTRLLPELAESWEANGDGTVWTIRLRPGLRWSDGQPLTTRDLYFAEQVGLHPDTGPTAVAAAKRIQGGVAYAEGRAEEIAGIVVRDERTIEYRLTSPTPMLPELLTGGVELAEHFFKRWTPRELTSAHIWKEPRPTSGPFRWGRYVADQYMEATPNPYYWRGRPRLEKLINRYFDNETTALLALQRGEIHFSYVSADAIPSLRQAPDLTVIAGPSLVTNFIAYNFREPALADRRVRQAILHAIDREKLIQTLYRGSARKVNTLFSQAAYTPADLVDYPYDPAKARRLLREARWQPNPRWEIITYYADQLSQHVLQAIQQYLAAVGVDIVPRPMDVPTFIATLPEGKDWKLAYVGQGHVRGPLDAISRWHRAGDPRIAGDCKNMHGCYSGIGELSQAIDEFQVSIAPEQRVRAAQEVARVMNRELPDAWLWVTERYGVVSKRVRNFVWAPAPAGGPYYDQAERWDIAT